MSNEINTYVRPKFNNLSLLLPPSFDRRILFDLVKNEADVHQLRNVMFEMKEIVHLYLEVFEGWVKQTEAIDKIIPYNIENIISDNVEESPQ
ncbi:unnamed protein product [Lactuca saligna]|uniref:Uncharacterized protein n=1 Tax=Lactuca saligna TaxID=75948 RepID=A0AA36E553_LACSI|nr:unnamed protein product [Lactuca saligna]